MCESKQVSDSWAGVRSGIPGTSVNFGNPKRSPTFGVLLSRERETVSHFNHGWQQRLSKPGRRAAGVKTVSGSRGNVFRYE